MPRSKVRKNKKQKLKNRKSTKQRIVREVFKKDGIEIIEKKNKVIFKSDRSPEEHKRLIEKLRKNRPVQLEYIKNNINRVIDIFENNDQIKLLGSLSRNQIVNQGNSQDDGLSEVILELGQSFATSISVLSNTEPTTYLIDELIECLKNIINGYSGYIITENTTGKYSELESKLRLSTISEALYKRGQGYTQHIYSIYIDLFKGHDEFIQLHYGFTSKEILDTILQLEDSFCCRLILPGGVPHPAINIRFQQWAETNSIDQITDNEKHFIKLFSEENPDLAVENEKFVRISIDKVKEYKELFKIRFRYDFQRLVVDAISHKFGDNFDFLNPKYKGFPLNQTLITTNPIIMHSDDYYLFNFALPTRNLIDITERLIEKADIEYYNKKYLGNKYFQSRDNFLEEKARSLLKTIVPDSEAYPNCKYIVEDENGKEYETELDLLLKSKNAIYLVEMKAGGLSASSKRGALKSLTGQLKSLVGYGAYQNYRAFEYILVL